jgi:hypothetical protein
MLKEKSKSDENILIRGLSVEELWRGMKSEKCHHLKIQTEAIQSDLKRYHRQMVTETGRGRSADQAWNSQSTTYISAAEWVYLNKCLFFRWFCGRGF